MIIGGGIAGLAAAARLSDLCGLDELPWPGDVVSRSVVESSEGRPAPAEIVLVEAGDRLGGKIDTGELAGLVAEQGAETFLMTDRGDESAAVRLARRVRLDDRLAHPAPVAPAMVAHGALRPIPAGTLLGVPSDLSTLDGVVDVADHDTDAGVPLLTPDEDIAVGALVRARFGDDVVDRLVDPMLGGVYAGRSDTLSLAATAPGLHAAAQTHSTLAAAVRAAQQAAPRAPGTPMFATVHGGMSELVGAIARRLIGAVDVRLGATARAMTRTPKGFVISLDSASGPAELVADAVVIAVPAGSAGHLLAGLDSDAGAAIAGLDYASVALVTLALPADTVVPAISGFLVPEVEGFAVKAATFFTTKWPHLRATAGQSDVDSSGVDSPVLVRASLGRHGDDSVLRRADPQLIDLARREVGAIIDAELPEPLEASVARWHDALPQYAVGHVTRVARARATLPATVALAGAAVDGVGIAACVRSGETAAEQVWRALVG